MKRLITSLLSMFIIIFLWNLSLGADKELNDQKQALQAFQAITEKFHAFFKNNPKFIEKELFSESPTGVTYSVFEYHLIDIAYDIQKTDSIVSPFIGYIDVSCTARTNASCGNVKTKYNTYGWDNIEDALKQSENLTCYSWYSTAPKSRLGIDRFIFAYQNRTWVFKDVIFIETNKKNGRLLALFGTPSGDYLEVQELSGRQYNQPWSALIDILK